MITILTCLNYVFYEVFVNYLVMIDAVCITLILIHNYKISKKYLKYLILLFFIASISCMVNGGGIGSLLVLYNFTTLVYISTYLEIHNIRLIKCLAICYVLLMLYWLLWGNLSLYNKNTIGIIALLGVCFGAIYSSTLKSRIKRCLFLAFLLLVAYQVENQISESRTCLICGLLLIVMVYILPVKIFSIKSVYCTICFLLTIGSLIWTRLYVYLYQNSIEISFGMSTKRFFSGREMIWIEMWKQLEEKWIAGVGTGYQMNSIASRGFNVHNSIFNFLVVYGVFVFVLIMAIIIYKFYRQYKKVRFRKLDLSFISMSCVFIIFFHAFSETTLISSVFYGPIFTLFCLVNTNETNDNLWEKCEDGYGKTVYKQESNASDSAVYN